MMSKEAIEHMISEMQIPFEYHHFTEKNTIDPPFLVYIMDESNNFHADGIVYFRVSKLNIELYSDEKDMDLEKKVETVLEKYQKTWQKTEDYIEKEQLYEVVYEMEV